jgi:hypothetical protein
MLGSFWGFYVALIWVGLLAGLVVPLWAVIDAISRPTPAFAAAGSSKAIWLTLMLVFWFFTIFIGLVLAVVYLASIRPRVRAATEPVGVVQGTIA